MEVSVWHILDAVFCFCIKSYFTFIFGIHLLIKLKMNSCFRICCRHSCNFCYRIKERFIIVKIYSFYFHCSVKVNSVFCRFFFLDISTSNSVVGFLCFITIFVYEWMFLWLITRGLNKKCL